MSYAEIDSAQNHQEFFEAIRNVKKKVDSLAPKQRKIKPCRKLKDLVTTPMFVYMRKARSADSATSPPKVVGGW